MELEAKLLNVTILHLGLVELECSNPSISDASSGSRVLENEPAVEVDMDAEMSSCFRELFYESQLRQGQNVFV